MGNAIAWKLTTDASVNGFTRELTTNTLFSSDVTIVSGDDQPDAGLVNPIVGDILDKEIIIELNLPENSITTPTGVLQLKVNGNEIDFGKVCAMIENCTALDLEDLGDADNYPYKLHIPEIYAHPTQPGNWDIDFSSDTGDSV